MGLTPLQERIRALDWQRFQALAAILARRNYGDPVEDVRDTQGEGNGLDAVLEHEESVHGFQARTVQAELGSTQKAKARKAVTDAHAAMPNERGKPLERFTFIFNIDLQPSESQWFAGYAERTKQSLGVTVDYHGLGWIEDQLLRDTNTTLRREFTQGEFDRQDEIVAALEQMQASLDTLRTALSAVATKVNNVAAAAEDRAALKTLLERATAHFMAGRAESRENEYAKAIVALNEALSLLSRHRDEPLYRDVVYWRSIALLGANRWSEALESFQEAVRLYRGVGRETEARFAEANRGHALHRLGRHDEAVEVFATVQPYWQALGDTRHYLIGLLNIAMVELRRKQAARALPALDEMNSLIASLTDEVLAETVDILPNALGTMGTAYYLLGNDEAAIAALEHAIEIAQSVGDEFTEAQLSAQLASPLAASNRHDEAEARLAFAERVFVAKQDEHNLGIVYQLRGLNCETRGDAAGAIRWYRADAAICRRLADHEGLEATLDCLRRLGADTSEFD